MPIQRSGSASDASISSEATDIHADMPFAEFATDQGCHRQHARIHVGFECGEEACERAVDGAQTTLGHGRVEPARDIGDHAAAPSNKASSASIIAFGGRSTWTPCPLPSMPRR